MFKNLIIYRTGPDWFPTPEALDEAIGKAPFVECEPTQQKSSGFVPSRGEANGAMVERIDGQIILKVAFLDVVFEGAVSGDKGETFDADVAISTGELGQLIPDLVEALGGEQVTGGAA